MLLKGTVSTYLKKGTKEGIKLPREVSHSSFPAGACAMSPVYCREVEEEAVAQHRVLCGHCSFPFCSADLR